ncbi:MAG: pirin family protein [Proteobacteria bacterium]|nr:MAG: pirin family protein [Pseudomonadota bacterium]
MTGPFAKIEPIIPPRSAQIGAHFNVKRILPYRSKRMVGPFIFLDEMGPLTAPTDGTADVLPHPHIGLSTVTYLFQGELMHRDSLGSVQKITPGDVNWMTAGRGITHSERFIDRESHRTEIHGVQAWVALPQEFEEIEPAFDHYPESKLPKFHRDGVSYQLIAGQAFGESSPVLTHSKLFYVATEFEISGVLHFDPGAQEAAFCLLAGSVEINGEVFSEPSLLVFEKDQPIQIRAGEPTRGMLLGGDGFPEPRFISWNFVSSSKDRLEKAREDWKNDRFPRVPGDASFVSPAGKVRKLAQYSVLEFENSRMNLNVCE